MIQEFCQWLYDTPLAATIRSNELAFPWLESVHVLAITLVLGTIAVADLRLLGIASLKRPVTKVLDEVLPVTWVAFAIAAITGVAMFTSNAVEYSHNTAFQLKMVLLVLAGLNMLGFQLITFRGVGQWDEARATPTGARFAGAFSLLAWIGIVAFGRWIGFTIGF
jgi:hypothetical protein